MGAGAGAGAGSTGSENAKKDPGKGANWETTISGHMESMEAKEALSGDPLKDNFLKDVLNLAQELSSNDGQTEDFELSPDRPKVAALSSPSVESFSQAVAENDKKSLQQNNESVAREDRPRPNLDLESNSFQQQRQVRLNSSDLVLQELFAKPAATALPFKPKTKTKTKTIWITQRAFAAAAIGFFAGIAVLGTLRSKTWEGSAVGALGKGSEEPSVTLDLSIIESFEGKNANYFGTLDRLLREGDSLRVKQHLAKNRPAKMQTERESVWARTLLTRWELLDGSQRQSSRLLEKECSISQSEKQNPYPPSACLVHVRALLMDEKYTEADFLLRIFWEKEWQGKATAPVDSIRVLKAALDFLTSPSSASLKKLGKRIFEVGTLTVETKIQVAQWLNKVLQPRSGHIQASELESLVQPQRNEWRKFFARETFRELSPAEKELLQLIK